MSDWNYQGRSFTSDQIGSHAGFVYLIEQTSTGLKYIGQKKFHTTRTLPPLKGKTRKRKIKSESNWKGYWSSSTRIQSLAAGNEADFTRTILHLCPNKQTMNYMELYEQVTRNVLTRADYANQYIGGRITAKGLQYATHEPKEQMIVAMEKNGRVKT